MGRKEIIQALADRGFTGEIELFFWSNDGWYCNCDQMLHDWIGQNAKHAVRKIKSGDFDSWRNNQIKKDRRTHQPGVV